MKGGCQRHHRGKKSLNFELQSLLCDGVQLFEQATDVQHMTTGEDTMGKSVVIPLHGDNIHPQHLFHPEALAPLVDQPQQDVSWPHSLH